MQDVLANLLLAHAPYAALVGNRCHWDEMPPGLQFPGTVMFVVSGVTDYVMSGASGLVMTRVQFDNRGTTAVQARQVADAQAERLSGFSGIYGGYHFQGCFERGQRTGSDKDGAVKWFTDSRDFQIHWAPA
jgi:hypothetical protein